MAYPSPLEKLLGYIDELDDILPEDDKLLLDEMEAYIEAAKRMHGQQETEMRHEIETQTARVQEMRIQLSQAMRDAATSAKAQQELSVTGAYAQRLERDLAATQGDLRALKASSAAAAAAHHKQVIEAGLSAEREAKQRYAAAAARSQEACDAALKRDAASAQEAANLKGLVQELEAWGNVVESQKNSAVAAAASLQEQVDYASASQERATAEAQRLKVQVAALLRSAAERPSSNGTRSNSGGGDNGRRNSRSRSGGSSGGSLLPPHEEADSPTESDGSNSSNSSALSNGGVVERAALSAKVCDLEAQLTAQRERVQATERFAFEQQARAAELQEALRKAEERASAAEAPGSTGGDGAAPDSILAGGGSELSEKHRAESKAKISDIAPRGCKSDPEGKEDQDDFKSDDSDGNSVNSRDSNSANTTFNRREILFHSMQSASKPALSHSLESQRRSSSSSSHGTSPSSSSSTSSSHDRGGSQQELRSPPRGRFRRISPEAGVIDALYYGSSSSNNNNYNDTYEANLPWAQNGAIPAGAHSRVPSLAAPPLPAPTPTPVQGGVSSWEAERAAYEGRIAALQEVIQSSRHAYSAEAASSRGQSAAEEEAASLRSEVLDLQQRLHDLSSASKMDTVKALAVPSSTPASNSGALDEASSAAALEATTAAKEALATALAEKEGIEKRASRAEAEAAAVQNLATRLGAELTELRATVRRLQRAATLQALPSSSSSSPPRLGPPKVSMREAEEQALVAAAGASSHYRAESKWADENSRELAPPLSEADFSDSKGFAGGVAEEKASSEAKREQKGVDGRRKQLRHAHSSSNSSSHNNRGKSRSPGRDHQDRSHRRAGLPNSGAAGMRPPMRPPEQPPPPELKPVWSAAAQGASDTSASAGPAGREKQRSMEAAVAGPEVETSDVVEEENQAEIELSPETADEWNAQPTYAARDRGDQAYGRTIFVAAKAAPSPKRHSPSKAQGSPRASTDIIAASTRSVKSPPPPLPPRNRGLSPTSLERDQIGSTPKWDQYHN